MIPKISGKKKSMSQGLVSFYILIFQWIFLSSQDNWHHLNDEDLVLGFFTFLDIAIKMTDTDEELMQVVPMKLLHQGLLLLSQPL